MEYKEQDLPKRNNRQDVQSQVIEDIKVRREVGIERYGTALQAFNGRNSVRDLYEELIDGTQYAKQLLIEREELIILLHQLKVNLPFMSKEMIANDVDQILGLLDG